MKLTKPWHQLDVEEHDNFRFRVQSESGAAQHFVDALENNGASRCDCKHFECRVAPVLSGKKERPSDDNWAPACKHILRVKLWIADSLLTNILKQRGYKTTQGP